MEWQELGAAVTVMAHQKLVGIFSMEVEQSMINAQAQANQKMWQLWHSVTVDGSAVDPSLFHNWLIVFRIIVV